MINRRKETRLVERNQVMISSGPDQAGDPVINAYTYDLSTGGARLCSNQFFRVGALVTLQVNLARTRQFITLEAEVKWSRMKDDENVFELGVEFRHHITATLFALIRHLYSPDDRIPTSIAADASL